MVPFFPEGVVCWLFLSTYLIAQEFRIHLFANPSIQVRHRSASYSHPSLMQWNAWAFLRQAMTYPLQRLQLVVLGFLDPVLVSLVGLIVCCVVLRLGHLVGLR